MIPMLTKKMLMLMINTMPLPLQVQMMFISMLVIKTRQLLMLTQMLMLKDQAVIDADTDDADRSLSEEAGRLVGLGRHHRKQHNLLENNVIDALLLLYFEFSDQP